MSYSHQIGGNREHKMFHKFLFSIAINRVFECQYRYYGNGKSLISVFSISILEIENSVFASRADYPVIAAYPVCYQFVSYN